MGIVQRITTSTRGLCARRFIGIVYYIGYKDSEKYWIMCIIFEKIFVEIPDPACILMESKNLRDGIPYPE